MTKQHSSAARSNPYDGKQCIHNRWYSECRDEDCVARYRAADEPRTETPKRPTCAMCGGSGVYSSDTCSKEECGCVEGKRERPRRPTATADDEMLRLGARLALGIFYRAGTGSADECNAWALIKEGLGEHDETPQVPISEIVDRARRQLAGEIPFEQRREGDPLRDLLRQAAKDLPKGPWRAVPVTGPRYSHLVNVVSDAPRPPCNFTPVASMLEKTSPFLPWLLKLGELLAATDSASSKIDEPVP